MKRRWQFQDSGFALKRILVVIAVLAVIAAIILASTITFISGPPMLVVASGVVINITIQNPDNLETIWIDKLGDYSFTSPGSMSRHESCIVTLQFEPEAEAQTEIPLVMRAELIGANFNIDESTVLYKVVTLDEIEKWAWSISPIESGEQALAVELFLAVQVDTMDDTTGKSIFQETSTVTVEDEFDWMTLSKVLGSVAALIVAIVGFIKLFQWKRKKAQTES